MAERDRITIDIRGLRQSIEAYRQDPAYQTLSLSAKIRLLLQEQLNSGQQSPEGEALALVRDFLMTLAQGRSLHHFSVTELADALDLEPELIEDLWGHCNGNTTKTH